MGVEPTSWSTDVTSGADLQRLIDGALERHGKLDIIFNNAGISMMKPITDTYRGGFRSYSRHQPERRVPGVQVRDRAPAGQPGRRGHPEHVFQRRPGRAPRRPAVLGHQARRDGPDEVARRDLRGQEDPDERALSRSDRHPDDRVASSALTATVKSGAARSGEQPHPEGGRARRGRPRGPVPRFPTNRLRQRRGSGRRRREGRGRIQRRPLPDGLPVGGVRTRWPTL